MGFCYVLFTQYNIFPYYIKLHTLNYDLQIAGFIEGIEVCDYDWRVWHFTLLCSSRLFSTGSLYANCRTLLSPSKPILTSILQTFTVELSYLDVT